MDQDLDGLLKRLARRLGPLEGEPEPLVGGTSGRHLRVRLGGEDYVVRRPSQAAALLGLDREAERAASVYAAAIGVGPEVVGSDPEARALVTRYLPGRQLTAEELRDPDVLADVGTMLATVHARGQRLGVRFDAFATAERYREEALARGAEIPYAYEEAAAVMARVRPVLGGEGHEPVPCHNDLVPDNLVFDGHRVRIVDWEFAGMGNGYFDLGTLSINAQLDEGDDEWLLTAYCGEPPTMRQLAALRLMRLVADFRDAMWAVVEATVPVAARSFDRGRYADEHLARLLRESDDPRFEDWLQEAA